MEYILKDELEIKRTIVFLCGPYYQKHDPSDRRNIMRDTFEKEYKDGILPLIIDDFLTEENLRDDKVNIQLMEEIFAAISCKTYVFLDTMSTAAEVGLFLNHAFMNQVVAYVPKESDIYNKKNVGYFVKDAVLGMNGDKAKRLEYRPAIVRSVIATDYAVEHYGFINNVIPQNIADDIKSDSDLNISKKLFPVTLKAGDGFPEDFYEIIYKNNDGRLSINISIRLLFYVTAAVIYEKYAKILKIDNKVTIADFNLGWIVQTVKGCFLNYIYKKTGILAEDIQIRTVIKYSIEEIIYHMTTFIYIYHCFSTYHGYRLVVQPKGFIIESIGVHPYRAFGINEEEYAVLLKAINDSDTYYTGFEIKNGKKKRKLVKYSETEQGLEIRGIHEKIAEKILKRYEQHPMSFAYKKGGSVKKCIEQHLESNSFLKYDISKFFNSINLDKLVRYTEEILEIDRSYREMTFNIIKSFYVDGGLPLGLVVSPVLSDMYMHGFDQEMNQYSEERGYVYTRYADDIMISQKGEFQEKEIESIEAFLQKKMLQRKLKLNNRKKSNVTFERCGQHIRYVGVNLVHGREANYLTVGKKYIYSVAKEYLAYRELGRGDENLTEEEIRERKFYEARRISGKVAFIKQIEGKEGWDKLIGRLGYNGEFMDGQQLIM